MKEQKVQDSADSHAESTDANRRHLLAQIAALLFASLLQRASQPAPPEPAPAQLPPLPPPQENEDVIVRMLRDVRRALQKPVEQRRWVMVIDLDRCVGCHACTVSCIAENRLPPGVVYRPVTEQQVGVYPNVRRRFFPRPCMHCDNPPCVPVCPVKPVKATHKRADGIVAVDYDLCIGCEKCAHACPYGARTLDNGDYFSEGTAESTPVLSGSQTLMKMEESTLFEYKHYWKRQEAEPPMFRIRKCHFCLHRLEQGLLPQCVVTCIGRATFFGDANDPQSVVSQLVQRPDAWRYKENLGTKPRVYYLGGGQSR